MESLASSVEAARRPRAVRGMVRERVGIVRKCFHAWSTNRFESLAHHIDRDVEIDWSASLAPYRGTYTGHAGWRQLFDEIRAPFQEATAEADSVVVQGQHIAVRHVARMRGRDGVEVVARGALVFTFRGVKLIALRLYQHDGEAFAAIGSSSPC